MDAQLRAMRAGLSPLRRRGQHGAEIENALTQLPGAAALAPRSW